ncbi:hypothetical protein [Bdellovibrio sp. HCB337]|uniref:hypothetical protein n=1 Tax=Bdellovibrio sp. HCB337 TaxID=3394358 RepID=UPI0039A6A9CA
MKSLLILISLFASISFAKQLAPLSPKLQPLFENLKTVPVNYKPEGAVCEQVARLQAFDEFPEDRFAITTGVKYDAGENTIGELDLIVVDKATRHVELVAEVKCWRDYGSAMDKAKVQRDRFMWTLTQFPEKIHFESEDPEFQFTEANFHGLTTFRFISQVGGVRKGFNQEIPYTLSEMSELREHLVRCQKKGECPLR